MASGGAGARGQAAPAPSTAPAALPPRMRMVDDERSYMVQGEMVLLVFVILFALLFASVFLYLCFRTRKDRRSDVTDRTTPLPPSYLKA